MYDAYSLKQHELLLMFGIISEILNFTCSFNCLVYRELNEGGAHTRWSIG